MRSDCAHALLHTGAGEHLGERELRVLERAELVVRERAAAEARAREEEESAVKRAASAREREAHAEQQRIAAVEAGAAKSIWASEARRISDNVQPLLGQPLNTLRGTEGDGAGRRGPRRGPWRDPSTTYVLTGSVEWSGALTWERRTLIESFRSNGTLATVEAADCHIDDEMAMAWAAVLSRPECAIRSLRLDSNPISSVGVEALAAALRTNRSLTELALNNLHGRPSREAEEALTEALEHNTSLLRLSIDLKSWKARDGRSSPSPT